MIVQQLVVILVLARGSEHMSFYSLILNQSAKGTEFLIYIKITLLNTNVPGAIQGHHVSVSTLEITHLRHTFESFSLCII